MKELARFQTGGQRSTNLDRIFVSEEYAYLIDGYGCSELSLDSELESIFSPCGHLIGTNIANKDVKLCFSGFTLNKRELIAHYTGDCRIYIEGIGIVSEDKTRGWELIKLKNYSNTEIAQLVRKHPSRNIITRYLSREKTIYSSVCFQRPLGNVMLCSDGFWSEFSEGDLLQFLVNPDIIQEALKGALFSDNAACIIFGFR